METASNVPEFFLKPGIDAYTDHVLITMVKYLTTMVSEKSMITRSLLCTNNDILYHSH